jgi:hypothetical protein
MVLLPEISFMVDNFISVYGTISMTIAVIGLFALMVFIYAGQFRLTHSLMISAIPFVIASMVALVNIYWGLGVFLIIISLMLALGIKNLILER